MSIAASKERKLLPVIAAFYLIVFLLLFGLSINSPQKEMPVADKGVLDLTGWDLQKDGNVKLEGEWEFYWKQLLTHEDFRNNRAIPSLQARVPDVWTGSIVDGKELPGQGYGTYRLRVKSGGADNVPLGLRIYPLATSYTLWIDDKKIASNGVVSSLPEQAVPEFRPVTFFSTRRVRILTLSYRLPTMPMPGAASGPASSLAVMTIS